MVIVQFRNENGELVGGLLANACTFKTGSRGYRGLTKIKIGDKRYQVSTQLVEIGSSKKHDLEDAEDVENGSQTTTEAAGAA